MKGPLLSQNVTKFDPLSQSRRRVANHPRNSRPGDFTGVIGPHMVLQGPIYRCKRAAWKQKGPTQVKRPIKVKESTEVI